MTPGQKNALTLQALGLLDEQLEARIVHYKAELQTSPELDAVTAQVVAQIKAMQAAVAGGGDRKPPGQVEEQQIQTLRGLLERVFAAESGTNFATQTLKPIGRRIAKLFFESELHDKRQDKEKVIHHAEQGVYYVLQRYKHRLAAELDGFTYVSDEIAQLTRELLVKIERDLQVGFLSRRSPELNRVLLVYTSVLTDFLHQHLPPRLDQLSKLAIRNAGTARREGSLAYKITADGFGPFRAEWQRLFMEQLVNYCGDELLARIEREQHELREETVRFFTDPHVFSETCEVLCEHLYDFLCLEGFLDLPVDWRATTPRG